MGKKTCASSFCAKSHFTKFRRYLFCSIGDQTCGRLDRRRNGSRQTTSRNEMQAGKQKNEEVKKIMEERSAERRMRK